MDIVIGQKLTLLRCMEWRIGRALWCTNEPITFSASESKTLFAHGNYCGF